MTFFSGTDMDTLNKIGESMNHCLSLIVNNAGKYNARLTRIVDETAHCSSEAKYKSFNDEQKTFRYEYDAPRKSVEWIPARINKMEPCTLSEEEISSLSDKIDSITKAKEEREKERLSKFNTNGCLHGGNATTKSNSLTPRMSNGSQMTAIPTSREPCTH